MPGWTAEWRSERTRHDDHKEREVDGWRRATLFHPSIMVRVVLAGGGDRQSDCDAHSFKRDELSHRHTGLHRCTTAPRHCCNSVTGGGVQSVWSTVRCGQRRNDSVSSWTISEMVFRFLKVAVDRQWGGGGSSDSETLGGSCYCLGYLSQLRFCSFHIENMK